MYYIVEMYWAAGSGGSSSAGYLQGNMDKITTQITGQI